MGWSSSVASRLFLGIRYIHQLRAWVERMGAQYLDWISRISKCTSQLLTDLALKILVSIFGSPYWFNGAETRLGATHFKTQWNFSKLKQIDLPLFSLKILEKLRFPDVFKATRCKLIRFNPSRPNPRWKKKFNLIFISTQLSEMLGTLMVKVKRISGRFRGVFKTRSIV